MACSLDLDGGRPVGWVDVVVGSGAGERGLTVDKRREAQSTAVAMVTCSACYLTNGVVEIGFGHLGSSPNWYTCSASCFSTNFCAAPHLLNKSYWFELTELSLNIGP